MNSTPKPINMPDNQNPYNIYYDNYLNTKAATECTGLGYRMALDLDQWNAYRTVFDFLPVPFQDLEDP